MAADLVMKVHSPQSWEKVLIGEPDVMIEIITDILKIVQSQSVTGRIGRRPAPAALSLDELWTVLFPTRFSTEPFPKAFAGLVSKDPGAQLALARKIPCGQPQISRLLSGDRAPTMPIMERIAMIYDQSPAYFLEWRAWRISRLVTDTLTADPAASVQIIKKIVRKVPR